MTKKNQYYKLIEYVQKNNIAKVLQRFVAANKGAVECVFVEFSPIFAVVLAKSLHFSNMTLRFRMTIFHKHK